MLHVKRSTLILKSSGKVLLGPNKDNILCASRRYVLVPMRMGSIGSHSGHGTVLGDPFPHADTLVVLTYPIENIDYLLDWQRSNAENHGQAPEFSIQAILGHTKG
jgi:hypothetical protein